MALGRWKQRAASLDHVDFILPEEDETHIAKKPRLDSTKKKTAVLPKTFMDRWKQDLASVDSLESTDTLLPEDDKMSVSKKHCLHSSNKQTGVQPKNFSGILDEDRPSSGDSGISSDNQLGSHQRLRLVQLPPQEATEVSDNHRIISSVHPSSIVTSGCKQEAERDPMAAVDLSKSSRHDTSNQLPSTKASIQIKSEDDSMNKENYLERVQSQKIQKNSRRTCGNQAGRAVMMRKGQKKNGKDVPAPVKEETDANTQNSENQDDTDSLRSRRIEANARERSRVHTIGAAFETLRQTVPSNCYQQKLSKLAVLRIAAAYIRLVFTPFTLL